MKRAVEISGLSRNARRWTRNSRAASGEGGPGELDEAGAIAMAGKGLRSRGYRVRITAAARRLNAAGIPLSIAPLAGSVSPWGYVRLGRNRKKQGPKLPCSFAGCHGDRSYKGYCDGHRQQIVAGRPLKPLYYARALRPSFPHPTIAGAILVPLTRGEYAIADADMADLLVPFKWSRSGNYATARWGFDDRSTIPMHRFLWERWGGGNPPQLDHINRDGLDNRRSNLRAASQTQNLWNVGISKRNSSGFKGVSYRKDNGHWRARIRQFGKLITLGQFDTPEAAHAAYASAAKAMRGEFARAA